MTAADSQKDRLRDVQPDDQARRQFWTSYMDEMDALVEQLLSYPCEECGEPLGSIESALHDAGLRATFSSTQLDQRFERIFYVRTSLLEPLVAIVREMNDRGWIPRFEDGFRTEAMQTALVCSRQTFDRVVRTCVWECGGSMPPLDLVFRRSRVMVANYGKTGTHTQGAAVDISVFRAEDGREVDRGETYLAMDETTPMRSPFVTAEQRANRWAITEIMERHGFVHFPGEFWHYNQGDVLAQVLTGSGQPGRYGPIHWDPATGLVTPYADPLRTLIPRGEMEMELQRAVARMGG